MVVDYCDDRMVQAYRLPTTGWWTWHFCAPEQPRRFDSADEAKAWLDARATADGVLLSSL